MASLVNLRVRALRRPRSEGATGNNGDERPATAEHSIVLSKDAPVSALWDKLKELGYSAPARVRPDGSNETETWEADQTKASFKEFELIEVVDTKSSDPTKTIHIDDRLIAYANRRFGQPITLNVEDSDSEQYGSQVNSLKDSKGLEIVFHRTVRMPDDDKIHQLPGSLGPLPLFSVTDFAERLPPKIVTEGGIFLPMWQREALWIGLESSRGHRYALRISVGRINAVSGEAMAMEGDTTELTGEQDYLVVPGQEWIDGICVAPGIVRQFVAMPLGSGYTVEGQKTGQEKHGGLQMEIIPSFEQRLRTWIKDSLSPPDPKDLWRNMLRENETPGGLGLRVGDKFRLYPQDAIEDVPFTISDMIGDQPIEAEIFLTSVYEDYDYSHGTVLSQFRPFQSSRAARAASPGEPETRDYRCVSHGYSSHAALESADLGEYDFEYAMEDAGEELYLESPVANFPVFAPEVLGALGTSGVSGAERDRAQPKPPAVTTNLKAMGLAAGGKLIQDVYRDYNEADIWNTEAAKLVHIHILDPSSCEAVTHIVPPPPPIDAMGYVEEGGAFFVVEEQPQNRVDAGDFEGVKSVSAMDKHKGVGKEPSLDPTQQTQCKCGIRLCDCVVRPCDHQFCNVCVREIDPASLTSPTLSAEPSSTKRWFCPTCKAGVSYVAGFAAPMNLPGEESLKVRVPVHVLEVKDGRVAFKSIERSRI